MGKPKILENIDNLKSQLADKQTQINNINTNKADKTEVNALATEKADKIDLDTTNDNLNNTNINISQNATDITSANERISSIIAQSGTSSTEVVDSRTDIRGIVYTTAKDRVDASQKGYYPFVPTATLYMASNHSAIFEKEAITSLTIYSDDPTTEYYIIGSAKLDNSDKRGFVIKSKDNSISYDLRKLCGGVLPTGTETMTFTDSNGIVRAIAVVDWSKNIQNVWGYAFGETQIVQTCIKALNAGGVQHKHLPLQDMKKPNLLGRLIYNRGYNALDNYIQLPDVLYHATSGLKTFKATDFPTQCPNNAFEFNLVNESYLYFDTILAENGQYPFLYTANSSILTQDNGRYYLIARTNATGIETDYEVFYNNYKEYSKPYFIDALTYDTDTQKLSFGRFCYYSTVDYIIHYIYPTSFLTECPNGVFEFTLNDLSIVYFNVKKADKGEFPFISAVQGGVNIRLGENENYIIARTRNKCIVSDYNVSTTSSSESVKEIVLPSIVPCVIGHEMNIYYDNILLNGTIKTAERVSISNPKNDYTWNPYPKFYNFPEFWHWIPTDSQTEFEQTVSACFSNTQNVSTSKSTQCIPVSASAGNGMTKKCLFIGDSLIQSGKPTQELLNLMDADVMDVTLLGTRGTAPNLHEGRGGWYAGAYCTLATLGGMDNPFLNNSAFDFSYYMTQQGYSGVDYVFINLGTNDIATTENVDTLTYIKQMVDSIKAYDSNITVFVGLAIPQSTRIDMVTAKNTRLNLIKLLLTEYDEKQSNKIFIVPLYLNLDPEWDFLYAEAPITSRHMDNYIWVNDFTHPGDSGYNKMADTIYHCIKYAASLEV